VRLRWSSVASAVVLSLALGVRIAGAATIAVNTAGDAAPPVSGDGGCTLREAIDNSNADADSTGGDCAAGAGADVIAFAVGVGHVTIRPVAALPAITGGVTIDGASQPGYMGSPIVELDGSLAGPSDGLRLQATSPSTIRALVVNSFQDTGIYVILATADVVEDCYVGTDVSGTVAKPNGVGVLSNNTWVRRNLISGNAVYGAEVVDFNHYTENRVGTDVTGSVALPNGIGFFVTGVGNRIGDPSPGYGNVISGNSGDGVAIGSSADANVIQSNAIGVDHTGALPLPNGGRGILLFEHANRHLIGGLAAGEANAIAYNGGDGVEVQAPAAENDITANSIHDNGGLGIRLTREPGSPNLPPGNHGQPAPTLTAAASGGGTTTVAGTLASAPSTSYRIDFYSSPRCDPSRFGEGERYLGSQTVLTNAAGTAAFTAAFATDLPSLSAYTATSTDIQVPLARGDTSEFSNCFGGPIDIPIDERALLALILLLAIVGFARLRSPG